MHGIYLLIAGYEDLKIKHLSSRLRGIYVANARYIGRKSPQQGSPWQGLILGLATIGRALARCIAGRRLGVGWQGEMGLPFRKAFEM